MKWTRFCWFLRGVTKLQISVTHKELTSKDFEIRNKHLVSVDSEVHLS